MKKISNKWKTLLVLLTLSAALLAGCGKEQKQEVTPTAALTAAATVTPAPTEAGTQSDAEAVAEFDAFLDEMFKSEIVLNTISLHYTLAHPENFGITDYTPSIGSFTVEGMKESYAAMHELKAEIEAFPYDSLTRDQQFTYDIIMDYIETELSVEDLLLYSEFLGPTTGYQAQLPVLLAEYKFRTVRDVEDYLALVAQVDELFVQIVEFEKAKSEAGLFMSDHVADEIIDQCRQFIEAPEDNYMIDVFAEEIEAVEGLSEEEKQNYIAKNTELITTEMADAYQILIDGLESLKGTGTNDKGLCYYEDGKRYYEYLVRSMTGSDKSVERLMLETDTLINQYMRRMSEIMSADPSVFDGILNFEFDLTDPEEILQDLIVKIEKDFPELPETKYTIKHIHPSMQEHMSPAFYLTPPVDDTVNNVIYINDLYMNAGIYSTMAHEGYPGHLYQNVYTSSKNLPLVRNLFAHKGYSEGWATYVEYYSFSLGCSDQNLAKIMELNQAVTLGLYSYVDMAIHYLGWGLEEVANYLTPFGMGNLAQQIYDLMLEEPTNYLSYFIGYMEFLNLRDTAETAWGEEFTLKKFHEAVLTLGPAPFYLLEEEIKEYE